MVPRTDPRLLVRSELVAEVDPSRCVSCGICAGSCAPMGVGPPGRSGRNQLAELREFLRTPSFAPAELIVVCCDRTSDQLAPVIAAEGAVIRRVDCAGSLHTSVIELLVRAGSRGVLILACPPRDCWNREGPKWLSERVYHDREAELQARVDRRRVRIAHADVHDAAATRQAIRAFAASLEPLDRPAADPSLDIAAVCEPPAAEPVQ